MKEGRIGLIGSTAFKIAALSAGLIGQPNLASAEQSQTSTSAPALTEATTPTLRDCTVSDLRAIVNFVPGVTDRANVTVRNESADCSTSVAVTSYSVIGDGEGNVNFPQRLYVSSTAYVGPEENKSFVVGVECGRFNIVTIDGENEIVEIPPTLFGPEFGPIGSTISAYVGARNEDECKIPEPIPTTSTSMPNISNPSTSQTPTTIESTTTTTASPTTSISRPTTTIIYPTTTSERTTTTGSATTSTVNQTTSTRFTSTTGENTTTSIVRSPTFASTSTSTSRLTPVATGYSTTVAEITTSSSSATDPKQEANSTTTIIVSTGDVKKDTDSSNSLLNPLIGLVGLTSLIAASAIGLRSEGGRRIMNSIREARNRLDG